MRAKASAWAWLAGHPWDVVRRRGGAQRHRRVQDDEIVALCEWHLDLGELISDRRLRCAADLLLTPVFGACELLRRALSRGLPG